MSTNLSCSTEGFLQRYRLTASVGSNGPMGEWGAMAVRVAVQGLNQTAVNIDSANVRCMLESHFKSADLDMLDHGLRQEVESIVNSNPAWYDVLITEPMAVLHYMTAQRE